MGEFLDPNGAIPPCSTRKSKVGLVKSGNPDLVYWRFTIVGGFIVNSIFN